MPKAKKPERFNMFMSREAKKALTRMALHDDRSRAEVIERLIMNSAMRRGFLDTK
jgi:hypothetical protein